MTHRIQTCPLACLGKGRFHILMLGLSLLLLLPGCATMYGSMMGRIEDEEKQTLNRISVDDLAELEKGQELIVVRYDQTVDHGLFRSVQGSEYLLLRVPNPKEDHIPLDAIKLIYRVDQPDEARKRRRKGGMFLDGFALVIGFVIGAALAGLAAVGSLS